VADDIGRLDPEAIAAVVEEAWPDLRSADELHDLLLDLGALPEDRLEARADVRTDTWPGYLEELIAAGRAGRACATATGCSGWRPSAARSPPPCGRPPASSPTWAEPHRATRARLDRPRGCAGGDRPRATRPWSARPPRLPSRRTWASPPDVVSAALTAVRG